jgi:enamine deaminase RidA (YjgF/YER057c/UK114 family)
MLRYIMDNEKQPEIGENPSQAQSGPDQTRRRLTGSALGVSAILTLASRPVLGGGIGGICFSPSGFQSGNLSTHGTPITCCGRTPGYWGNNSATSHPWPSPYLPGTCTGNGTQATCTGGTLFYSGTTGFSPGAHAPSAYLGKSMMNIVRFWNQDPYQLGAHIVAALLNAKEGWTPPLTESMVRDIWNSYAMNGYFEPTAGVQWDAPTIVAYLQSTQLC